MPTERRTRGPRAAHRPPKHGGRALARHLAGGTLDGRTGIAHDFYGAQGASPTTAADGTTPLPARRS